MKEQLDRQERERQRERGWEHRRYRDAGRPGKSPPRLERPGYSAAQGRVTMADRLSARVPSPPSPRRERVRRCRDDSDVEEGEVREEEGEVRDEAESPRHGALSQGARCGQERGNRRFSSSDSDESPARRDATPELVRARLGPARAVQTAAGASAAAEARVPDAVPGESRGQTAGGEGGESAKARSSGKPRKGGRAAADKRAGSKQGGGGGVLKEAAVGEKEKAGRCGSPGLGGESARAGGDGAAEDAGDDRGDEGSDGESGSGYEGQEREQREGRSAAKGRQQGGAGGSKVGGGGGKRKGGAAGGEGERKMTKAAMLKEFTRAEVRAGEALLSLYDYYFTATQQVEASQALPSAEQIGDNLVQKELQDAMAARIQVGARVKGKWKALKGGLTWYAGSITHVNRDETVDVMYDDGDMEQHVPLRFIQLLDKQPTTPLEARGMWFGICSSWVLVTVVTRCSN